ERRVRGVVPFARHGFTTDILRRGDDLEVLVLELGVDSLPTWQIKSAPSPGRPGEEQHLLPAETRERDGAARAIGDGDVGRLARFEIAAAQRLNLAEAPRARIHVDDDGLLNPACEGGEI